MKKSTLTLCALSLLFLAACGDDGTVAESHPDELGGETLATVDGVQVSDQLIMAFIRQYPNVDPDSLDSDQREQLTDHVINLTVLALEAERRGLDTETETRAALALERMQTLSDILIERMESEDPISDEDIEAFYQENYRDMREYRASHILVEHEDQARDLLERLNDGEDFAELAEAHSLDGSASEGGDLGWFNADQMVAPFAEAVRSLEPGETTGQPVQTDFGWHLVKLEDVRESEGPSLDEVREEIRAQLQQDRVQRFISELREQADVERR